MSTRSAGTTQGTHIAPLMAAVLVLYFIKRRTQKQVALELNVSTATVNRFLRQAHEKRLVEFKVRIPEEDQLSVQLQRLFPSDISPQKRRIVVVSTKQIKDPKLRQAAVGRTGAIFLEQLLSSGRSIAIDGGESVARVIEYLEPTVDDLELFPVAGGPLLSSVTSVPALIGRFLGKYGPESKLRIHFLPGPIIDKHADVRNFHDAEVSKVLHGAESADVFLLGIGAVSAITTSETADSLLRVLKINKRSLLDKGVVGVIGYSAFDSKGNPVESLFDERVFKARGEAIQDAARNPLRDVIVVASGEGKAKAIRVALSSGWMTGLVTDFQTAEAILAI